MFTSALPTSMPRSLSIPACSAPKSWIADPDGVIWEAFLTEGESTVYGESPDFAPLASAHASDTACCAPKVAAPAAKAGCC